MADFDWVSARAACSIGNVYEEIRLGIERDVQIRNAMLTGNSPYVFATKTNNDNIVVFISSDKIHDKVTISRAGKGIAARDGNGGLIVEGSLTLNDDGQCLLKVNGQERDLWQFRTMALEVLLFEIA